MDWRRSNFLSIVLALAWLIAPCVAAASEYRGQVTFGGLPVPGATVTATQGGTKISAVTDDLGQYSFADLKDGKWSIDIEMTGFANESQEVVVEPNATRATWELKLLPLDQVKVQMAPAKAKGPQVGVGLSAKPEARGSGQETVAPGSGPAAASGGLKTGTTAQDKGQPPDDELSRRAADGFLINGSTMNGAASPFAQSFAFGNRRNGMRGLYNGGIGFILDNSALDARPFSLSGQNTPKPAYNRITGLAALGGPLKIPHILEHGVNFFVGYQWTRSVNDTTQSALVPDAAERDGDFSQALNALGQPVQIFNPATGLPFSGNLIPAAQISPQARALLNFYPLPGFSGDPRYNYQIPIVTSTHQDALQSRFGQMFNPKNQLYGGFAFQSTRTATPNLFGFLDTTDALGIKTSVNWSHRLSQRSLPESRLSVQPAGDADHSLLGESRQRFRRSGHHGEQSGPGELGPAQPRIFQRRRGTVRRAKLPQPQSDRRRVFFHVVEPRSATTSPLAVTSAGSNSITCRNRTRAARSLLPARPPRVARAARRPAATILPTFCWEFRTRAPSLSATRTNTFGNPFTTPTSPTIGE